MVVSLGPGKFYGSSLPRPHIYTDVKLNTERVDPPMHVMEPLLSWANEAHWSMGGLSFKRHRLQGRIEGNIKKLRSQKEKVEKDRIKSTPSPSHQIPPPVSSPPLAAMKRRRLALIDEEEEDVQAVEKPPVVVSGIGTGTGTGSFRRLRRGPARKLGDDFDRVATPREDESLDVSGDGVADQGQKKETAVKRKKETAEKKKSEIVEGRKRTRSSSVTVSPKLRTSPRLSKN